MFADNKIQHWSRTLSSNIPYYAYFVEIHKHILLPSPNNACEKLANRFTAVRMKQNYDKKAEKKPRINLAIILLYSWLVGAASLFPADEKMVQ